jgi:ketosteroid isomerase-like protein
LAALNRRDAEGVLDLFDPGGEWWDRTDDPDATVHRGRDGVGARLGEMFDAFDDIRYEADELIEIGARIVVTLRIDGQGRGSGARFEEHEVWVLELRNGKIVEGREYREKAEALESIGEVT